MMNSLCTMNDNVNAICRSAFYHLKNIAAIRPMLTEEAAAKLIHAFVTSRLDSFNSLLTGSSEQVIHKLQRVQNAAARLLKCKSKCDSISAMLKELHWLPVRQRCTFKLLTLIHKCVHGRGPGNLTDIISLHQPSRSLRSANQKLLFQPCAKMKTYGDRAFSVAGPQHWNSLPPELCAIENYDTFKGHFAF